jgi:hypothetical protein
MKTLVYIALVIVLTAPLVWAWNPIRKWMSPEQALGTLLLRVLALLAAFIVYGLMAFWLALFLMGLIHG